MIQGQSCHSCGGFPHHYHIGCYENRDGGSNIQNGVVGDNTPTYTTEYSDYSSFSSSSSSVDCTLSLGTPSTRLSDKDVKKKRSISSFLDTSKTSPYRWVSSSSDALLDRRCTNCDTTSTPLWRNGPQGPKSLCNACGIRFKKEEKMRTTTVVVTAGSNASEGQYGNHSSHGVVEDDGSLTCNYGGAGEYYRRNPVDGVNSVPFDLTWRDNESCV